MKVKELKTAECFKLLKETHLGRLACSLDDQPYIVPFNYAFDDKEKYLYAFSTVGQKIEWMRENSLVCVEVEHIKNQEDWITLVIFGRFEELPDKPEFKHQRTHAHDLLSKRPMWWQPAYVSDTKREEIEKQPVYFRVYIEKITGHRAYCEDLKAYIPSGQPAILRKDTWRGLW